MRNRVNMIYGETIFKTLKFDVEDRVNMGIAEEPCRALRDYTGATVATYGIMAWDSDGDGIGDNDEFHYWLFMLYIDGDNNLDPYVKDIMDNISSSLPTIYPTDVEKVNETMRIVGEYDGDRWGDSGRYEIRFKLGNPNKWEAEKVKNLGEVNMAKPSTLESFINWAESRYWHPNRRVLIIIDHGSGWLGLLKDEHHTSGEPDWMSLNGLKNVFLNIKFPPDLVFLDACVMQMAEVDFEIGNIVKIVVGSQDTKWMGDMYSNLFNTLSYDYATRGITIYLDTISSEIVGSYEGFMSKKNSYYTISAVDQYGVVGELTPDINLFANALIDEINSGHGEEIKQIISDTQHMNVPVKDGDFYNHSYRDLYDFAERIRNHFGAGSSVGRAAWKVMNAIEAAVVYESHRGGNYHGISIFLPDWVWWTLSDEHGTSYRDYFTNIYRNIDFAKNTAWDEFIKQLYGV